MTTISKYDCVSFQDLRVYAHQSAKQTYDQEYPQAYTSLEKLGAFRTSLDTRISELEGGKVTCPAKEELLEEKDKMLNAYWEFMGTAQRAKELAKGLSGIATFLTPQPRLYSDKVSLKDAVPELHESLMACDAAVLKLKSEVSNWWGKMDTLQTKMFEQINTRVSYSLQKFCLMVDNEGKPLGSFTNLFSYGTPIIPKPQPKEVKNETSEPDNSEKDATVTSDAEEQKLTDGKPELGASSTITSDNSEKDATITSDNSEKDATITSGEQEQKLKGNEPEQVILSTITSSEVEKENNELVIIAGKRFENGIIGSYIGPEIDPNGQYFPKLDGKDTF